MEVDPQDHDPDRPLPYVEDARRAQLEGDGAQPEGVEEREGRVENVPHPAGWWERNWGWVVVAVGAGIAVLGGITVVYYLYRRIKRLEKALGAASNYPKHQEHSLIKNAVNLSQCQRSIENLKQEVKNVSNVLTQRVERNSGELSQCQKSIDTLKQEVKNVSNVLTQRVERNSGELSQCQKSIESLKQEVVQNSGRINRLAKDQLFHDKKVLATEEKLLKTQRFVVDMAQRQKWPWPFNNRVHGLEEELGLPKK